MNKTIHLAPTTTRIFDDRTLETDYATLVSMLQPGMHVLDVGCGTGAISAGIAKRVGGSGYVTGIDNTEHFILSGKETYGSAGFHSIEVFNADEMYRRDNPNFTARAGIWSKVAGLKQISDEGWIDDATRLQAIEDYDRWVDEEAESMTMKLNEVRGRS